MKIRLIRHATLWLEYGGVTLLVDPMFSEAGANPPIVNTANALRNPLVPLPVAAAALARPDAVLVTHRHPDHWDAAAIAAIPHATPLLCQPADEAAFRAEGFERVAPVDGVARFQGIALRRTGGQHGTGDIGARMGPVSGFVLRAEGEPSVYIAGDTIWCADVAEALKQASPDVIVVNAGGARFVSGGPITMDAEDVVRVLRHAPRTKVIAVHMDAINHCEVRRADLRARLAEEALAQRVAIPADGEWAAL